MLNVESKIAPFMAEVASRAGATKLVNVDRVAAEPDGADQRADADADGQQVEQRLEEAGGEHEPGMPVDPRVPLDQVRAAPAAETRPGGPRAAGRAGSAAEAPAPRLAVRAS